MERSDILLCENHLSFVEILFTGPKFKGKEGYPIADQSTYLWWPNSTYLLADVEQWLSLAQGTNLPDIFGAGKESPANVSNPRYGNSMGKIIADSAKTGMSYHPWCSRDQD